MCFPRLEMLQKQMVGGEEVDNTELKERRRRKKKHVEERKKKLAGQIQTSTVLNLENAQNTEVPYFFKKRKYGIMK